MKFNVRVIRIEELKGKPVAVVRSSKGGALGYYPLNAQGKRDVYVGDKLRVENGRLSPRDE